MGSNESDTNGLVSQAADGDSAAMHELMDRHRDRLLKMIAVRMDQRIQPRVDPSDIVQEALAEAAAGIVGYARERPVSFYPWLRRIAWQQLVKAHRRHIEAQRRTVVHEQELDLELSDQSICELTRQFAAKLDSPSGQVIRNELRARVQSSLNALRSQDREILVLRYLEQLSMREIGEIVGCQEATVRQRHARALQQLQKALDRDTGSDAP